MTQCELILNALSDGGTITNTEAVENLGIARLASTECMIFASRVTTLVLHGRPVETDAEIHADIDDTIS